MPARNAPLDEPAHLLEEVKRLAAAPHAGDYLHAVEGVGVDLLVRTVEEREEIPLVSTVADRERILASGSNLCYSTYGDVFEYGTILDDTKSTEGIMGDIRAALASIGSLGYRIAGILNSIEKKG